jgi:hypothetical protein
MENHQLGFGISSGATRAIKYRIANDKYMEVFTIRLYTLRLHPPVQLYKPRVSTFSRCRISYISPKPPQIRLELSSSYPQIP